MYPNRTSLTYSSLNQQRGSMLVISIFVIVIMAFLGFSMVRLLSASADAVIHEVYGLRALNSAQSAMEQKILRAFPLNNQVGVCDNTINIDYSNIAGFENCVIDSLTCTETTGFVGESTTYYRFASRATCSGGKVTASRSVAVDAIVEP